MKICPICNNDAPFRLEKEGVEYCQCSNCKTIFSEPLDNDNLVGGGAHEERNTLQNYLRVERVNNLTYGMRKEDVNILDFGCGFFRLGDDLKSAGFVNTYGFDPYNEEFSSLPERGKYDVITAIEVIEHTSYPYSEIDVMYRSLKDRGLVIFETSFVDVANEENIALEDFFYISAKVGHSTIFSHHGLDLIMAIKGFVPFHHINRHVRVYLKTTK